MRDGRMCSNRSLHCKENEKKRQTSNERGKEEDVTWCEEQEKGGDVDEEADGKDREGGGKGVQSNGTHDK